MFKSKFMSVQSCPLSTVLEIDFNNQYSDSGLLRVSAAKRASCRLLHDLDGEHLQVVDVSSIFGAVGASPAKVCLAQTGAQH